MKTARIFPCLIGLALAACGDDGSTSNSATLGNTSSGTMSTTDSTSNGSQPTTGPGTGTDTASGSMGNTEGQTTGTPTTGTPTTGSTTEEPGTSTSTSTSTDTGVDTTTTGTTTGTTTDTTGPVSGSTTDDTTTSTTGNPNCMPGDTQGMGDVEKSFLWVANTDQGSISKVDTQAVVELARYRSGPNGANESPSRTAVSVDGRFVVVNGRRSGRVTMIAANLDDCVDANGNGMIDTSQNPGDLRAWQQDECVLWSTQLPFKGDEGSGPRGVTWTPGTWNVNTCAFEEPKVWVGYLPVQNGIAHMARLNGLTGAIEETVTIPNWFLGDTYWGPYGAALDKDFKVWFTGLRGELFRLNTDQNPVTVDRWAPPGSAQFYGMTVDPDGDPWFGGCLGPVTTFNPLTQQFTAVAGTNACYRGLAADKDGHVWVASNSPCGVAQINHVTNTLVQFHNLAPCSTPVGVSVDDEGYVWVVDEWQGAWKIDPINPVNKTFLPIGSQHYTYSDMTGGQLKSVVLPQ